MGSVVKHYRSADGVYLGGFTSAPAGGVECPAPLSATDKWSGDRWLAAGTAGTLEDLRATKFEAVSTVAEELLAAGAPHAGLHITVDDGSRADLTAMAATAMAALSGAVAWPESYARGWISTENERIPLPTPADGFALAASVGDWYARIIQRRRDLKDSVLAAADAAAIEAIDVNAGWPD